MSFDLIRKMSLRRQILWGTQLFTAVVSLLVGGVLFALSDSYIRTTTLRSVEFNLQQMAASVQSNLDTARNLLNWASTDSTLRRYLTAGQLTGPLTTSAYEIFSDRYLSSQLQTRIVRFFVTNGSGRFLQQGNITSSAGLNAATVALFDGPDDTLAFAEDPLLPSHPLCLVLRREIRPDSEKSYTGWAYLGLDSAVIELKDIVSSVEDLKDKLDFDAKEADMVDERLDLIRMIFRKYGGNYCELVKFHAFTDNKQDCITVFCARR